MSEEERELETEYLDPDSDMDEFMSYMAELAELPESYGCENYGWFK